jgi:hypothetical protein
VAEVTIKEYTRIQDYENYLDIYKGNHYKVFEAGLVDKVRQATDNTKARIVYIALNFAKLIANKFSDLMFLDPIKLDSNMDNLPFFEKFMKDSMLHATNWKLGVYTAVRGDGLYRLAVENNQVMAKYTPPEIWFVEKAGDQVVRHIFEWVSIIEGEKYIRRETYERGRVRNEIFRPKDKNLETIEDEVKDDVLGDQLDIKEFYPGMEEEVQTRVDSFLVYHFKNNNTEEFYGTSEFEDLMPLFDELNNRITQVSKILDVHATPEKFYPQSFFQMDKPFYDLYKKIRYIFKKSDAGVHAIPEGEKQAPFALTWDAKLESTFTEIKFILESMLSLAEMAPHMIFMKNMAETEESIRLQMTNTVSKVRRKRMIFEPQFVNMFTDFRDLVLANDPLKAEYKDKIKTEEFEPISIKWGEPIPVTETERLGALEKKVKLEAISERRKIQEANPELTDEQVDEELKQIQSGYKELG